MSLLIASQLAKAYGPHDIFANVEAALPRGARAALVGPNGAGKTTLLRLLAGEEEPSQGIVQRAKGVRLGYLPQEAVSALRGDAHTVWDEMLTAFSALRIIETQLAEMEARMAAHTATDTDEALFAEYGELQHQFEVEGGYTYPQRIRQVLAGLNFTEDQHQKPIAQLSGGQKTRALLARLLLEAPEVLILDEPTNHLDIHAIEWLEEWLNSWDGTVLMVSHDRYFMDRTVNVVWALDYGRLELYRGNYSAYVRQRDERWERQRLDYAAQQELIAKEQDFIRRNLAGQNTRQAKGRRRRLERMLKDDTAVVDQPREQQTLKLNLKTDLRSGDRVLETHDLRVGYPDKPLFDAPDLLLWREECAALVGPNGAGKSTFLKTLLGELNPLAGSTRLGSSLKIGYFAQAHEGLDPQRTVLEEIQSAQDMPPGRARDYLAKFLFTEDDVFKSVSVLSGGERGRLALAKLALSGANFLLLDEPTNHLDIPSQEILQAVLADFPGTILLVSHDRYLIDGLATQIWALEGGQLQAFAGTWSEFVAWRDAQAASVVEVAPVVEKISAPKKDSASADNSATLKLSKNELRKRVARLTEMENAITALEQRLATITRELETAGIGMERARALGEEYAQVEVELGEKLEQWAELAG